jgi:uncharacterized protein YfdQ (DUF2303 family)
MEQENETRTLVDAALEHLPAPVHVAVGGAVAHVCGLPRNFDLRLLEAVLDAPGRARGTTKLHDARSFAARVADDGAASGVANIYCAVDYENLAARFVAVLNDHSDAGPGWCDLRAVFNPRPGVEWARWIGANRKPFAQSEFAAFLEDNLADVAAVDGLPTGSQMLELALNMEAQQERRLRSSVRLQSGGVELVYVDKDDDATTARLRVFDRFAIGVAPFLGGERYQVTARLRYRAKDGAVTFWFELVRPDLAFADALGAMVKAIEAQADLSVLYGEPPEPLTALALR